MSDMQTRENFSFDSPILAGFGIDCVSQKWQKSANVSGLFAKTAPFGVNNLATAEKTNLAPACLPASEGRQPTIGGSNG